MLAEIKDFLHPFYMIWKHKLITVGGVELTLGSVTVALVLLLFASRLSRLTSRWINRRLIEPFVHDKSSQITYQTFAFYACLGGFVTLSLTIAGIPLTIFTVVGGALAIGVGFGSQNIVNNFISGVILMIEKPVKVGDIVEVDNVTGSIISIGTRSTKIKTGENKIFIVPNSFFLEKGVMNWNFQTSIIRASVNFGVSYNTNPKEVENICLDILLNTEDVVQYPMPKIFFENFGDNALDFQIIFWCNLDKVYSLQDVKSQVRFKIFDRFKQHGIEIPFPQRDMNLKIDRSLEVKVLS